MINEDVLGGAILGSMLTGILMFAFIFYIITVIATWKIFTKANIEGWKSLIPIYNAYLLYKIAGTNFWIYGLLIPMLSGMIQEAGNLIENNQGLTLLFSLVSTVMIIYASWKFSKGLATAFGKGTGFALGLLFLPGIFELILGFGSAKFQGTLD